MHRLDLVACLADLHLVDYDRAVTVVEDSKYAAMTPDQALVAAGLVSAEELSAALSSLFGIPHVSLKGRKIPPEMLALIPRDVARNYAILPLDRQNGVITLAMADPLDVTAEDVVRFLTSCRVERVIAERDEIMAALEESEAPVDSRKGISQILETMSDGSVEVLSMDAPTEEEAGAELRETDAPVIQLVNTLLLDAVKMGASDIHIEPQERSVRVRYRVDGALREICEVPKTVQNAMIARTKLISSMDIAERRRPQDGRTRLRIQSREVDFRVNTLPSFHGEKIVLRLLDKDMNLLDLQKLGFLPEDLEKFEGLVHNSQGMVIITGPTGSGKTSTLYATLNALNKVSENIITVEDPVEFQLKGINQVQIQTKAGLTFASALRAILRQDPDIVMVGEIRDLETAEIAFQASQTGHFVLSTLHTNSAAASITRLGHMGVPPFLTAASLLGVVAQRLVRRICEACRHEVPGDERLLRMARMGTDKPMPSRFYAGRGCDACEMTGFRGRVGLYEVLPVTEKIKDGIFDGASELDIQRVAQSEGMNSLLEDGLLKVEAGHTTLGELLRVVTVSRKSTAARNGALAN